MSFTADIYRKIQTDIARAANITASHAMRKITEANGIDIVFAVNVDSGMRAVYFSVIKNSAKKAFPRWKGIDIQIASLPAYGTDFDYVALTQLPLSEGYIFEIVVEDLRSELAKVHSQEDALPHIYSILTKWKDFFQADKDLLLSPERQQGLYGELLFLEECLEHIGFSAIMHWAGSNDEVHDFYIAANAVEVKTTSKQAPYFATISSEYQLDNSDVPGRLFLRFYALRKSQSTGERLPVIISRIRERLISEQSALQQFNAKILKYGYMDEAEEHYTTGYYTREQYYFAVVEGFPRIIKKDVSLGVADLTYSVSIAQCVPFAIEKDAVFSMLKGGAVDA